MTREIFGNGIEYKIKTVHKIFGEYEVESEINKLINNEEKFGIVAHGKEIYCYKSSNEFSVVTENNMIIISDELMKIFIYI